MKAELVKRQDRWDLYGEDGSKIASSAPNPMGKLSLKNCEAIANGYDLDELAESIATNFTFRSTESWSLMKMGIKIAFQKLFEIIGDKKFSEEDMLAFGRICTNDAHAPCDKRSKTWTELLNIYIQSLQQTEWDVEIMMEEAQEIYRSGVTKYIKVPKLDADGCLILKRIDYGSI